ncbi:MAG: radical SAM protein [Pseudomonadota bacterium]
MPPYVIPVFIPHQGCPQRCIFCDQSIITGNSGPFRPETVSALIEAGLKRKRKESRSEVQVAFYGGTFTGIDPGIQETILSIGKEFCEKGAVNSLRLSTRPDYISPDTISRLKKFPVETVELGVQSMNDDVLALARRGHCAADSIRAVSALKAAGFHVGIQIMIGLPGEPENGLPANLGPLFDCGPEFLRIYPTLVLKGTILAGMYRSGAYKPLELQRAIDICGKIYLFSRAKNVRVVRMGLQPDTSLERSIIDGPYHPAFGEMVKAEVLKNDILKELVFLQGSAKAHLRVSPFDLSLLTGSKRRVWHELERVCRIQSLKVSTDYRLGRGEFHVGCQ